MKYTTSDGRQVELSQAHLDASLRIYEELRKSSPSQRVSWARHKKMMEQSGFFDSESTERYRCAIKEYRKKMGTLPSVEKHADMVADSKLDGIKQYIGEIRESQLEAQNDYNRLNRLKREMTRDILLYEAVQGSLSDIDYTNIPVSVLPEVKDGDKVAIAVLTDIHYGAIVDTPLSEYNPEIAEQLIMEYADKLLALAKKENIKEYYILNLGDIVEGELRPQSLMDTDMVLVNQAIKVSDIIVKFIFKIAQHVRVKYSGIGGNHDRISKNAKENIDGNNVQYVCNAVVERILAGADNAEYIPLESLSYGIIEYGGKNVLAVHGDVHSMTDKSMLAKQSQLLGKSFDLMLAGHRHNFSMTEVAHDRYMVSFGSIKGTDSYSIRIASSSCRSQGVVIFDEDNFEVKQIKL